VEQGAARRRLGAPAGLPDARDGGRLEAGAASVLGIEVEDARAGGGHADLRPTSVEAVTGRRIDTETAARQYAQHFERVFGARLGWLATPEIVKNRKESQTVL